VEPSFRAVDERQVRTAQAAVGVLLLGAFVFRLPELVVGVTVVLAVGAVFGPRLNGFHVAYRAVLGSRRSAPADVVAPHAVRALDVLGTVLLLIACAGFAVGIDAIGWLVTLIEAAVAIIQATTGYNAALDLLDRIRRER
jgi:Domain of unknown function (DUF4395)